MKKHERAKASRRDAATRKRIADKGFIPNADIPRRRLRRMRKPAQQVIVKAKLAKRLLAKFAKAVNVKRNRTPLGSPKTGGARSEPRRRGRPPNRKSLYPGGFAGTDTRRETELRDCVLKVLHRLKLDEVTLPKVVRLITRELNHLLASRGAFLQVKRSKRGQRPTYDLRVFLGMLERHCSDAGIDVARMLRARATEGKERFSIIVKLLNCAGIRRPQSLERQWRQRIRFRQIRSREFGA